MRDDDGRKLDHTTLEVLRLRAVDQVAAGVHPEDVADTLGMHRKTVYGWVAKLREGGRDALKARPVPGRPRKLDGAQLARVYQLVVGSDPRQLKFEFALWTRDMIRELIRREFGVALSAVSVGRMLKTMGLSPQKPLYRAWQADPEAVAAWKATEYPKIAAEAKKAGATVYFADEASVRSDDPAGTTWAPVGTTPNADGSSTRVRWMVASASRSMWNSTSASRSSVVSTSPLQTTNRSSKPTESAANRIAPAVPSGYGSTAYDRRTPANVPSENFFFRRMRTSPSGP